MVPGNVEDNLASPLHCDDLNTSYDIPNTNEDRAFTDPLFDAAYIAHLEEIGADAKIKRVRPKEYVIFDESLREFVPLIDLFLEELLSLESRGCWPTNDCARCHTQEGTYQCVECSGREMLCMQCIIKSHKQLYLHRIQKWNGAFFEKVSLKSIGLRVQLGHPIGLDFCGCGKGNQQHTVQLLRACLFPATVTNPKTAATIEVLDLFSILSYESKMSAFQFYHSLSRLTDNTGLHTPKDRYPSFLRMAHEWRHLLLLKRAGRGHDPNGAEATKEGECAVLCPACPQPGKNMAENWQQRPEHLRFLDTLFVAMDANFRLKRKNVSSHESDPGLSKGLSYFVEDTRYRDHIKNYISEAELKSSCSRHDAVNLSETRPGQGHAATGVGAVVCSRHDMKRPSGVAQLQKGERYCNMDYIFYSTLKGTKVENFVVSYDIVCQWSKHLRKRMALYDSNFSIFEAGRRITYLVPKFHLPAHVAKCRTRFSFNLTKNVGRTDGESPERGWVGPNALAPSTKEMGPGTCRDTLDVHFGDENHKKVMGLGASLLRKIMAAARDMAEHIIAHRQLESTLSQDDIDEWLLAVEAWESDSSKPNPFETTVSGPTQAAVRRQLAEDERRLLEQGRDFSLDDRVTPSVLISMGIDLENEHYKEACSKLWEHSLDRQHTKLVLRGSSLIRKIEAWSNYQLLYLPVVARLRDKSLRNLDHSIELKAHELPLWLPSQIRSQIVVPEQYRRLEFDLRIPQACEALDNLRSQLQFKDRFVRGQGANTRARNTLEGIQNKIDSAASEYRAAYEALCHLGPTLCETAWKKDLLPLKNEDIRDLSEGKAKQSEGGGRYLGYGGLQPSSKLISLRKVISVKVWVRIEWAKSRARANRFTEEVLLLTEEMMRVERFFAWKANDWELKADMIGRPPDVSLSSMRIEGWVAYAKRQAAMYRSLITHFRFLWQDTLSIAQLR
ncbi:hypothetical protein BJ912DRAFT_1025886 [Pholiota molesta]|nr:hypothetical protein BJ912DRAFT_1025886 [Pholiota molesta]